MSGPCLLDELDHIVDELNESLSPDLDQHQRKELLIERARAATGFADHVLAESVDRVLSR